MTDRKKPQADRPQPRPFNDLDIIQRSLMAARDSVDAALMMLGKIRNEVSVEEDAALKDAQDKLDPPVFGRKNKEA